MPIYDSIGKNYNTSRIADKRITNCLLNYLKVPVRSLVADIGAGTGNYSYELARKGLLVHALEPSALMIGAGKRHKNITWFQGTAEELPFKDDTYMGAISTLASHHFSSLETAFAQIHRILHSSGSFVLFTFDPRLIQDDNWIGEFFEPLFEQAILSVPPQNDIIALLESIFERKATVIPFPLPVNLTDKFFFSGWAKPELYLNKTFRNGISSFSRFDKKEAAQMIPKLKTALHNGSWDAKYGNLRHQKEYKAGYYFVKIEK